MITLVLGGNKSGKSDFALDLLAKEEGPALFIATGKAKDLEFREQIRALTACLSDPGLGGPGDFHGLASGAQTG